MPAFATPEVLRALLAGLIAGFAVALASTTIMLLVLWRDRSWFQRVPSLSVPLPVVGVIAMNGFILGWTLLGVLLGAALHRIELVRPAGGLGSPNLVFTLVVLVATVGALGIVSFVRERLMWPSVAVATAAALSFGWLLPWLGV